MEDCLAHGMEADRLSVYFEEIGAYQHKRNKELKSGSSGEGGRHEDTVVEWEMSDPDMDDYSAFLEEDDI